MVKKQVTDDGDIYPDFGIMNDEDNFYRQFRTDDTELRDKVNESLKTLAENGKMDEIGKKYEEIYDNLSMINQ